MTNDTAMDDTAPGETALESRIYLDHAATTPVDPRVLEAMLPYYQSVWANPSGIYRESQGARKGLDRARDQVAATLECAPSEIVFTSGGTEADNHAIRGVIAASPRKHIVSSAIEHHAVLHTLEAMQAEGYEVTFVAVDSSGFVDPGAVQDAVRDDTGLVTIMTANNEVGTIEPIAEIARAVKAKNAKTVIHSDAVQAVGATEIRPNLLGVDLMSMTAHKIYGPKGVGALYVRRRTRWAPQILGGGQEGDRRAGTENVAGAVAFATALRLAYEEFDARNAHQRSLRDTLWREIRERIDGVHLNGPADFDRRLSNNLSVCFERIEGESILLQLDIEGIAASAGSACTTGSVEISHVLEAMGVSEELAHGAIRLTVGTDNDAAQIERVARILPEAIERLRALSPV